MLQVPQVFLFYFYSSLVFSRNPALTGNDAFLITRQNICNQDMLSLPQFIPDLLYAHAHVS